MNREATSALCKFAVCLTALLFAFANESHAALRLPHLISDHMVMQADKEVPIWGWADPNEKLTVEVAQQKLSASADEHGKWMVRLKPLVATDQPLTMTISGSSGPSITVKDILVGEVWIGSGQSNMVLELPADFRRNPSPSIRVFLVTKKFALAPVDDVDGAWAVSTFDSLASFSWVFFQFGEDLQKELKTPMGLIQTTWGGTSIQAWIPAEGFTTDPNLKDDLDFINRSNAEYQQALKAYHEKPASPDAKEPQHPFSHPGDWPSIPTLLYNAMIHPLAPYAIRGFLWYQGENNVFDSKPELYSYKMKVLIGTWRRDWRQDDLPFYYVQLPPCNYKTTNSPLKLTRLWQAQTDTLGMVPNVGMAATSDVGDINDIHPGKKEIVARRLAMIALHQAYGRSDIVSAAPRYLSHTIDGERIRVKFRDVGGGLVSSDGKSLTWFQIAGEDSQFVDAKAEIDGDTVVVSQIDIAKPVAVRFAWENIAQPNLASKDGLPAIPFSTVRW